MADTQIHDAVREKYGTIATALGTSGGCCGPTACGCGDPITFNLYSDAETQGLPADAVAISLGCIEDARSFLTESGLDVDRLAPEVEGRFASAFIRARKPEANACCGPECCA